MLVLRSCSSELKSYGGFQWVESGPIAAPDWQSTKECGKGLHGFAWGEGNANLANLSSDAKWLVCEVDDATAIDLVGKVKFPNCIVVFCGTRDEAVNYLLANGGFGHAVMFAQTTAGDSGTATAGNYGTATAGYAGKATAGNYGTATAGNYGTATAGNYGTATAGDSGLIEIAWWDESKHRRRITLGYIGEDGLEANVAYKLDEHHKFVKV
jgi:hypothetical protein